MCTTVPDVDVMLVQHFSFAQQHLTVVSVKCHDAALFLVLFSSFISLGAFLSLPNHRKTYLTFSM
jgi:hypothetical protein